MVKVRFVDDDIDKMTIYFSQYQHLKNQLSHFEEVRYLGSQLKNSAFLFKHLAPLKIALLSNFVCHSIESYLRADLYAHKINLELYNTGFNQVEVEINNLKSELYQFNPEIIFLLLDENTIMMHSIFNAKLDQLEIIFNELISHFTDQINLLRQNTSALIVVNTLVIAHVTLVTCIDSKSKNLLQWMFYRFNQVILQLASHSNNFIVIDTHHFLQQSDVILRDERLALHASMKLDDSLLREFSKEITSLAIARFGLNKKCLVLDLDNTLWGGVIGDDALQGIRLGGLEEGRAYKKFQIYIQKLKNQGIILAINSKNDLENVMEVFDQHPDSVLKLSDFSCIKVNWLPKHENMLAIAKELNISLESCVFVDDSLAEIELMRGFLPEVHCITLPKDPALFVQTVSAHALFFKLELTAEDMLRTNDYLAEKKRKTLKQKYNNYENYLVDLAIDLRLFIPNEIEMHRISQLTFRTNQFNLTGLRYDFSALNKFLENGIVIGVESQDKFGKNGIVGAVIANINNNAVYIENLILSCRVFSRGIENAVIYSLFNYAQHNNLNIIYGKYIKTEKNNLVKNFYLQNGFEMIENFNTGQLFKCSLSSANKLPHWISISSSIISKDRHVNTL